MKFNKTKIVCSIGPACESVDVLKKMIDAGMSVARFNMSHGTHESHEKLIDAVNAARSERNAAVAIMIDTKGPEIRVKQFKGGKVELQNGKFFTLTTKEVEGDENCVSVTYANLPKILKIGTKILLNDGNLELKVEKIQKTDVICQVVHGGVLSNNKSINLPGVKTDMPYLSEQDKKDLIFAKQMHADFVAISFVGCREDVLCVRKFLSSINFHPPIISKIESEDGVKNFDEILKASDGIMVARGDLGVEIDFEQIPILQKEFIEKCNKNGKISITATQMLESMITSSRPTRAEISDVANAVFDGSTAIMLSGETASGANPVESVATMSRIASTAEKSQTNNQSPFCTHNTSASIGYAAFALSQTNDVSAIVVVTKTGTSAKNVSRFRPQIPIIACTPSEDAFHKMSLLYGVLPVMDKQYSSIKEVDASAQEKALSSNLVKAGEKVVLVSGTTAGKSGSSRLSVQKL